MFTLTAPAMRTKALPLMSEAAVSEIKPDSVIMSNRMMLPWIVAEI